MKKRILALVLCVLMVLALFPMSVFAEDKYEIVNGDFWNGDQKVSVTELIQAGTDISVVSQNEEGKNTCVIVTLDGVSIWEPTEATISFSNDVCYGGVSVELNGDRTEYVHVFNTYVEEKVTGEIENDAVLDEEPAPEETGEETEDLIEKEAKLLKKEVSENIPEDEGKTEETASEEVPKEITEGEEKAGEPVLEEKAEEELKEEPKKTLSKAPLAAAPLGSSASSGDSAPKYTATFYPFEFEEEHFILKDQTSLSESDLNDEKYRGSRAGLYAGFVGWYYYEEVGTGLLTAEKPTLVTPKQNLTDEEAAQIVNTLKSNKTLTIRKNATVDMKLTGDITLYGEWKYKVTFKPGEGIGRRYSETVGFGEEYTAPECRFKAPKGKIFSHWLISIDDPTDDYTEEIDPGDYAPAIYGTWYGNLTLTAIWEDIKISSVTAVPVTPLAGAKPNYSAVTVTSDPEDAIEEVSIEWFGFNGRKLDENAVFEAGKTYTAMIHLTADDEHTFAKNAKFKNGDIHVFAGGKKAVLTLTWKLVDPTKISEVDAFVDEPKAGEKPDLIAKYKTLPEDGVASYGDVIWYTSYTGSNKPKDWTRMKAGSTFKAGRYYLAAFSVEAKKNDLSFLSDLAVTVNGKEVDADDILVNTEKGTAYFEYIWYVEEVKETKISHVEAKIDSPVVGERPDYTASFLSTPKNALEAYEVTWYIYDEVHKDWDRMSSNKTFKKGETYGVMIEVYADDEYVFKKSVTGSINGFEHDERFCDIYDSDYPYEIVLFHSWKAISDKYTVTGTEDWYKGSKESLSFRSSASFKKFKGVKVDGVSVAEKNYTAESGSTVVALKPAYLETLAIGYHTVTIVSTDGEVSMEFEVHGDPKVKCNHSVTKLVGMKEATCTEKGYTGDRVCKSCGAILEKGKEIAAAGHHYVNGTCTECGMRKDREKNPDTGASLTSLAVAAVLAAAAATLAYKKRK